MAQVPLGAVKRKKKSSIMVAVQATEWVRDQLTRNRPYLARSGERCSSGNTSAKTSPPIARDACNSDTTQPTAVSRPGASFATKPTTPKTTTATPYPARQAKVNPAPTPSENAPAAKKYHASQVTDTAPPGPGREAQPSNLQRRPPPLQPNKYGDHWYYIPQRRRVHELCHRAS